VPADRFFGAAAEVRRTLQARVAANALELARQGLPKQPFYLTGQVGGQAFSVHAEGERVILTGQQGRQEIDLAAPVEKSAAEIPQPVCPQGQVHSPWADAANSAPPAPGGSAFDEESIDLSAEVANVEPPTQPPAAAGYADEFFDLSDEPIIDPDEQGGER
jgi:hypothetical protein